MAEEQGDKKFDAKAMDEAAVEADLEWYEIKEKYPEATQAVADFMNKWVAKAGWKRLGKVVSGRWG